MRADTATLALSVWEISKPLRKSASCCIPRTFGVTPLSLQIVLPYHSPSSIHSDHAIRPASMSIHVEAPSNNCLTQSKRIQAWHLPPKKAIEINHNTSPQESIRTNPTKGNRINKQADVNISLEHNKESSSTGSSTNRGKVVYPACVFPLARSEFVESSKMSWGSPLTIGA